MATILLVEDDQKQLLFYKNELRNEGYEIITADNGKDAVEKAQEHKPDMVIMDILLPKMDGIEAMGMILGKNKEVPIIIHTAYSNYKDNFMAWAADAYIVKSSDLTKLKNKIKELLANDTIAV